MHLPTADMSVLRAALNPSEAGHKDAVRSLTSAAAAASLSDQSSSTIRLAS